MWHYGTWIHSPLTSVGVVHFTSPSRAIWHTHSPTFNKWHKKKKVTLHILTHGAMRGCGLTSLVAWINDNIRDIRERNVTIRSAIWKTNIRSQGFLDTREWVILQGVDITEFRVYIHTYIRSRCLPAHCSRSLTSVHIKTLKLKIASSPATFMKAQGDTWIFFYQSPPNKFASFLVAIHCSPPAHQKGGNDRCISLEVAPSHQRGEIPSMA